jgi:hypothetical protein
VSAIPSKQVLIAFGVGVGVIAIAVAGVFYMQRGAHIELKGAILKVRTAAMDEASSVAVIDFRFTNPADYPFVVRTVSISMEDKAGKVYEGAPVSEVDAKRLFQYYTMLGQKYNETLLMRDKIPPRSSEDRMIAARFEVPVEQLDNRRKLLIRIEDVDGPVSELSEK